MTPQRIKEIQAETAYPESVSVQQALLKVWHECGQELSSLQKENEELRKENAARLQDAVMNYNKDLLNMGHNLETK